MTDRSLKRIGIDIGGTFTDVCLWDGRECIAAKSATTPHDLTLGVLAALEQLGPIEGMLDIVQGSTVATNALLERKGVRTAFITTAGLRDILRIGRQNRPNLYDLHVRKPAAIVAPEDCYEIPERLDAEGNVLEPLDEQAATIVVNTICEQGINDVAICLLFSFLNAEHEQQLANIARKAGLNVSCSHEVLPEFREFERASTTAVNAYVAPLVRAYLDKLVKVLRDRGATRVGVMQSNGGQVSAYDAARYAANTVLSGPAGGVVAAHAIGRETGFDRLVAYDMGGTSTDVSLCVGTPTWRTDSVVDGWPIRVPMLDIHTIGAGGGSIADLDAGGALQVGPESAGADPGPACYGKGNKVSVTDANVVLGRLRPEFFLGGTMAIDPERSQAVVDDLAKRMNTDRMTAALGVIRVANANMERAIKAVSAERGEDPRSCMLVSFGGAGGLHACALAESLDMQGVIAPANAGILSATGMLHADIVRDYSVSIPQVIEPDLRTIRSYYVDLMELAAHDVQADGYEQDDSELDRFVDLRYRGQSHEVTIPVPFMGSVEEMTAPFHEAHKERFGYADADRAIEIVTLRMRCTITTPKMPPLDLPATNGQLDHALTGNHTIETDNGSAEVPFYERTKLLAGDSGIGPAIIAETHTTTYVPSGWQWQVHPAGHIVVQMKK